MKISIYIRPSFRHPSRMELSDEREEYVVSYSDFADWSEEPVFPSEKYAKKIAITKNDFDFLTRDLFHVKIDLIPEFAIGLDGTICIIQIENGWNIFRYRVWGPSFNRYCFDKVVDKILDFIRQRTDGKPLES